jgi:hypothetical protein
MIRRNNDCDVNMLIFLGILKRDTGQLFSSTTSESSYTLILDAIISIILEYHTLPQMQLENKKKN